MKRELQEKKIFKNIIYEVGRNEKNNSIAVHIIIIY